MNAEDILKEVHHFETKFVGSRATCTPPPMDTDQDILCLVPSVDEAAASLAFMGFTVDGNPEDYAGCEDSFLSLKKGELNFLLTEDRNFFEKFVLASSLAKRFNLLEKSDRIALFQAVLYQDPAEGLELI